MGKKTAALLIVSKELSVDMQLDALILTKLGFMIDTAELCIVIKV